MKIALVGTGQMGQAVERIALERGHEIVARFDELTPLTGFDNAEAAGVTPADIAIDFTLPAVALEHIRRYCSWGLPAVVGTTGWYADLAEVNRLTEEHDASLLYSPNFSIGVALLVKAIAAVAPALNSLPEFDAFIHEWHHVRKVDSPSGTAVLLADTLRAGMSRKTRMETETQHGRIPSEALHVTSTRVGHVFGKHIVGIDSPYDSLEFVHEAKSRVGFAYGAVRSAEWLNGRRGLFTLDDVLADLLNGTALSA